MDSIEVRMKIHGAPLQRLRREIRVWSCLKHENVLPLLGVTSDFGPYTAMVCPWIATGSLYHFLGDNKEALTMSNRLKIVRPLTYFNEKHFI